VGEHEYTLDDIMYGMLRKPVEMEVELASHFDMPMGQRFMKSTEDIEEKLRYRMQVRAMIGVFSIISVCVYHSCL
tara:strand:- start:491 stop:715 length:225 start_codon:yes stop_codon:yes gene_type:complete